MVWGCLQLEQQTWTNQCPNCVCLSAVVVVVVAVVAVVVVVSLLSLHPASAAEISQDSVDEESPAVDVVVSRAPTTLVEWSLSAVAVVAVTTVVVS